MIDLNKIPKDPGCYLYKDKNNNVIYVGKAKNLKKRVKQYFQKDYPDEKTTRLVKEINSAEFFITDNEVEALILENNLIKKYKPKFNINLKESQRYAYILITEHEFPKIITARDKSQSGKYFGPYVSGIQRTNLIKILNNIFKIRTCNKIPKRPCLRYHMKSCLAPCVNECKQDYDKNIKNAITFLKGDINKLLTILKKDMLFYSKNLLYEKAKTLRDQIEAINIYTEKQKLEKTLNHDQDIINYINLNNTIYLIVFNAKKGILLTKNEYIFEYKKEFLEEFITLYYSNNIIPKEIIIKDKLPTPLIKFLEKKRQSKISITNPKIGEKLQLLELVKKNIEQNMLKENIELEELKNKLNLTETPYNIECFDISNTSGSNNVGSMVRFSNSKPDKQNYRRFKIRSVQNTPDDFTSIKEIVYRRYYRLKTENKELPNLIIIDGGKGQLSAAHESLKELDLKIPIIGIAKKEEEIFFPGSRFPLKLNKTSPALKLLTRIRDEAHRFAIKYHRLLRSKEMLR